MWNLSSSDEDDDKSLLPVSGSKFLSPKQHKEHKKLLTCSKQSTISKKSAETSENEWLSNKTPPSAGAKPSKKQLPCQYGAKCYRKNPKHLTEFSHPKRHLSSTSNISDDGDVPTKKSRVSNSSINHDNGAQKIIEASLPHRFMLSTVSGISRRFNKVCDQQGMQNLEEEYEQQLASNSMGLSDLLNMGRLVKSAHFNYCIDVSWLVGRYPEEYKERPMLLVHGDKGAQELGLKQQCRPYDHIELCRAELPIPFGTHHTKMILLQYEDGLRVIITTANLVAGDWAQKTQGMWVSPLLPVGNKDSSTNFKRDLALYLAAYKKSQLNSWIEAINKHDFSEVNVMLVASVPGSHDASLAAWGHLRLGRLLRQHSIKTDASWPLIAQFSSIGSLGKDRDAWLCGELLTSMSACKGQSGPRKLPPCKLVFPCVDDVRMSLEGYPAGASLPYSSATAAKQPWLAKLMHKWRASHCGRSEASPHIKTYCRVSPYESNLRACWFLLTSANLSKSAWGSLNKAGSKLMIRSYELGVLFLPSFVYPESNHFKLARDAPNSFPIPIQLPLTPYTSDDIPWTWDSPHTDAPDRNGNMWVPS